MPSRKVAFQVVHAAGEDELHPASELNSDRHGPLIQGWISQKFCLYPIDLIIQFDRKIVLKKVQILSHQFLIASKIEFYIGDCADDDISYQSAKYTRLGYVELSSNERTEFKARELKSVHVDAEGTFLKFVVHKNFVNKLNTYNQVGLIALNVIGTDLHDESMIKNFEVDPTVLAAVKRPDYISPLDDLAFAMYQDPEISQIIRDLDKKKSDCVIAEKYDEAKRLKQAISELYKIGERLARYDIEKRQAIEEEDYEKAKLKKQQMQEYRAETYRQLQMNNLLDFIDKKTARKFSKQSAITNLEVASNLDDSNFSINSSYKELPNDIKETDTSSNSPQPLNSPKNSQYSNKSRSKQISPISHRQHNNANQAVNSQNELDFYSNKPATPYDDRVIPTLRHNSNNPNNINNSKSRMDKPSFDPANNTEEEQIEQQQNSINEAIVPEGGGTDFDQQEMYDPMDGTEEMTESEVREAALMNDYLGKQIVTKLYSKNFQNREDAIQEVFTNLSNYKGEREEAKALMRASAILVAKMSKDNVFSIFNNALKLEQFLLNDFAKRFSIGKQEMNYVLEKCLPVLLHRTGDTNARLRQRAHEFIVEMAMYPEIKPLNTIPLYCIQPIKLHIAPRLALSRVEILEDLMKQLGYKDNGLNVDNISKFCSQALEHTSGEVRELAAKILIQMYRENGQTVRRYLPPDNEMNRRNKKYRILYDAFDGIDGKPIQSYDKIETSSTPRFNRAVRTPNKSKTPVRGTSLDRKTPNSIADESEYNPDNTCMFCGEVNEKFVKQGLEMHYWKSCPMLKQCNDCKQVIEVAVQTEHLLTECQFKLNYKKCGRCSEAVNVQNNQENEIHFKLKQCMPNEKKGNRCPLCHTNLGTGEEIWKEHLMATSGGGCTKNSRKNSNNNAVPDSHNKHTKQIAINQKK